MKQSVRLDQTIRKKKLAIDYTDAQKDWVIIQEKPHKLAKTFRYLKSKTS